ncbi:TolC family protein [Hydrogenophaga sp. RWCD_12]|uniref:TolC family protein n=1 Tax=Hydrogenophaga sp. RWCD_12 TaxID=3391190 RepID=UPI0039850F16
MTQPAIPLVRTAVALALALLAVTAQAQPAEKPLRLSPMLAQPPVVVPHEPEATGHWALQAERWQPGSDACGAAQSPPWERLTLGDALALTLCKSPTLRQAIAEVTAQSANVELGEVAFWPSWNANVEYSSARNFNSSGNSGRTLGASVGLSWALFDFGQRSAGLREARFGLAAAMASQGNTLLESVREVTRLYGEAVVASAALDATIEAEATANQTAAAAQARYEAQVGSQIDRLQAQTALAQATLERVRAQSSWESARGKMALALGGDVEQPLRLAEWTAWTRPGKELPDLATLRREARSQHPKLRAAQAQVDALQARLEALQAQARGSVTVSASGGSSRNWGAAGNGNIPTANAAVIASIPLFNGRESSAQQAQVVAQKSAKESELETARRDVDSQLWQAHQALLTSRQSLLASERLLVSASGTYRVAQGRYKAGVGSVLELLNAQSALAEARRQRVASLVDQLTARTQLGLAAGRAGL